MAMNDLYGAVQKVAIFESTDGTRRAEYAIMRVKSSKETLATSYVRFFDDCATKECQVVEFDSHQEMINDIANLSKFDLTMVRVLSKSKSKEAA